MDTKKASRTPCHFPCHSFLFIFQHPFTYKVSWKPYMLISCATLSLSLSLSIPSVEYIIDPTLALIDEGAPNPFPKCLFNLVFKSSFFSLLLLHSLSETIIAERTRLLLDLSQVPLHPLPYLLIYGKKFDATRYFMLLKIVGLLLGRKYVLK